LWLRHLDEANSPVELVGVFSAEQEKSNTTNFWVINRCLDDEPSKSLASERTINEYIAEPPEGGSVSHSSGEANLRT
jgi:hypothetical protein